MNVTLFRHDRTDEHNLVAEQPGSLLIEKIYVYFGIKLILCLESRVINCLRERNSWYGLVRAIVIQQHGSPVVTRDHPEVSLFSLEEDPFIRDLGNRVSGQFEITVESGKSKSRGQIIPDRHHREVAARDAITVVDNTYNTDTLIHIVKGIVI